MANCPFTHEYDQCGLSSMRILSISFLTAKKDSLLTLGWSSQQKVGQSRSCIDFKMGLGYPAYRYEKRIKAIPVSH